MTIVRRQFWIPAAVFGALLAGLALYPQSSSKGGGAMPPVNGSEPAALKLTDSAEDQDHPAITQSDDTVYVAYVEFSHSNRSREGIPPYTEEPKSFDYLARPAGGDQVLLVTYSKSKRSWSDPRPVSAPKQDIMRASVAVDGSKRVWVFWSANKNGNFDIYAKSLAGGQWSSEVRLTSDPGTDLNPVAAVDAKGRVWVAWQGFRNNNLEVLAAAQDGDGFTKESTVSFSKASDWDPAIAAAPNGEVAVSWDTYDKGDYDVYFRRLKWEGGVRMDAPVPVAASQNFEARSSVAYDAQSRLWVAYEAASSKWGKDFGAYETTGVSLYQNHSLNVKCFQGSQAFSTQDDLLAKIPNKAVPQVANGGADLSEEMRDLPDPNAVKTREANQTVRLSQGPLNSFPRITAGPDGNIYLAFRTVLRGRSGLGAIWGEKLVYFDGAAWNGVVDVPHSENYLDQRAAMAALAPGDLMMIVTTDSRKPQALPSNGQGKNKNGKKPVQRPAQKAGPNVNVKSDIYATEFHVSSGTTAAKLKPLAAEKVAGGDPGAGPEAEQVAALRNYRTQAGSDKVQLMRGEFHRHTEISGDGGRDGPIIDAYRYLIDAASMDWGGCCDHDNGGGRESTWWLAQKLTDAYHLGTRYVPMFAYERSVVYPEGHRNTVIPHRGIRPLPRLPLTAEDFRGPAPDTQMLYKYLKHFDGIVASHTSGTGMGTDWRDNDPLVEPAVEIYQGDRQNYEMPGAPRTNSAEDSIGNWRPLGFVSLALKKGYRLGFEASSDHISTHMSYTNLWVTSPTREGIMEAFHKRRVYGSTDNILADVRCDGHFMGEEFTVAHAPSISVKLRGMDKFAKVHIIKDGSYAYSIEPKTKNVDFVWKDNAAQKGQSSYYYVRGEQVDGELVWVSPMWITYK
jgi:hypothetical protein